MEDVKVHYNSDKPAQLQAHAYAQGTEIHIAPGQENHLPHEAWHIVQQKSGRVKQTLQIKDGVSVNNDAGLEREADIMGNISMQKAQTNTSFNEQVTQSESSYKSSLDYKPGIIQKTDDDHTTLGADPALWSPADHKKVKENLYSRLRDAKDRALAIAKAYALAKGAPAAIHNIKLEDFEITQRAQTGYGRIPVEQVYSLRQGQVAASGNDNRREWIITVDIDDPPYSPGGQRPHVGYTVVVRSIGANAVGVPRDIGHVWLDAVPAGRGALRGVNIWG